MSATMTETPDGAAQSAVRVVEKRAATADEAIGAALSELGITRDQAIIDVLTEGTVALPGETVSAEARVRVAVVDERTARAKALLEELMAKMRIASEISLRAGTGMDGSPVVLDVHGDDLGLLIGWRGETLRAVQTVLNLMLDDDNVTDQKRVIVDVERYRARREDQVRELALRLANRVKRSGERYTLDPMQPYERRVVHLTLADDPGVRTESSGKEPARRIVIHATGPAQPELPDRDAGPRRNGGGGWRDRQR